MNAIVKQQAQEISVHVFTSLGLILSFPLVFLSKLIGWENKLVKWWDYYIDMVKQRNELYHSIISRK